MFGDLDRMWDFLSNAPYFIVGSFLATFTVTKLVQSETLYQWLRTKQQVWRSRQAQKVRCQMASDIQEFLRGRQERDLSAGEQHLYYRMIEYYHERISQLYPKPERAPEQLKGSEQEDEK